MAKIKDGWHQVCGYTVLVEDGMIVRGIIGNDLNQVPAYVYRADRNGHGWNSEGKITVDAFRAGVRRGTIELK